MTDYTTELKKRRASLQMLREAWAEINPVSPGFPQESEMHENDKKMHYVNRGLKEIIDYGLRVLNVGWRR